jgi:ABC-type transporter Mla MlaB component
MREGIPSEEEGKGARRRRPEIGADFAYVVVHEAGRGTVAWIRGDLSASTAPALVRHVIDTLNLPLDTLVLDLADVADIDHHGLAALQVAQKRATMRGVSIRFDGLDDEMRSLLECST